MGTNNDRNLAEKLRVMSVDDLNKTNVLDILLAAEDNTKKHLNAAIELCVKYIEPRKPGTVVTLLDDHPEVQEYLDTMKKYRSISVNISDLL
jgi:DNA integrity scanning protein DisA with diadenylate cyclase activity